MMMSSRTLLHLDCEVGVRPCDNNSKEEGRVQVDTWTTPLNRSPAMSHGRQESGTSDIPIDEELENRK